MTMVHSISERDGAIFNRAALLRNCMEERSLAHNLLELYLADLPPRAAALRTALNSGNYEAVRQVAHAIRGASLSVGAQGMAKLAQDIENACRRGDLARTASVLPELERLMAATREQIQCMLGEEPPR